MKSKWELLVEQMKRDGRRWQTSATFLLFFLTLWLRGPWSMLLLAVSLVLMGLELRDDYRRRRPRQRMRDGGVMLGSLTVVFIGVVVIMMHFDPEAAAADPWEILYPGLLLACVTGTLSVVLLWRWRRLRAEAEVRLWQLQKKRKQNRP